MLFVIRMYNSLLVLLIMSQNDLSALTYVDIIHVNHKYLHYHPSPRQSRRPGLITTVQHKTLAGENFAELELQENW